MGAPRPNQFCWTCWQRSTCNWDWKAD